MQKESKEDVKVAAFFFRLYFYTLRDYYLARRTRPCQDHLRRPPLFRCR